MAQDVVRGDARLACFVGIVVFFVCVGGVNRMYGNGLLLGLFLFYLCVCVGGIGGGWIHVFSCSSSLLPFRYLGPTPSHPTKTKQAHNYAPTFTSLPHTTRRAARRTSRTDLSITTGDLPPSSRMQGVRCCAAACCCVGGLG